jgi:hypothetical protein
MNDLGEFYSGSKKLSSATGEEKVIDAPIITFTGDDAQGENQNRSSGIFDDVLVKERITVEGGENGNQSSQFYGPVNFTKKVTNTSNEGINTKNLFIKGTASQGKLITVGISTPTFASSNAGDISLKANPTDGYIGQVYVNNKWKKFGLISDSADILDIKVDKLGIGSTSDFIDSPDIRNALSNAEFYVAGDTLLNEVTFAKAPIFASGVTLSNTNFAGLNITGTARFTGTGGTSYAIYVDDPVNLGSGSTAISRLYNLEVANNAYISGNLGIGTTGPITKLDVRGNSYISGDLGIGTSTPTQKLDVNGNIGIVQGSTIWKSFSDNVEEFLIRGSATVWNPFISYTPSSGTSTRGFRFGAWDNTGTRSDWVSFWNSNVGIGTTTPGNKLVVNGTIGIDGSSSTAGRTLLSSSASGFVLNHNHSSPITFQTQSVDRLAIGAAGTITALGTNSGTETRGTFLRITNAGNGGDSVISWDNTYNNTNQRWYAGIDISDNYAWKLARPIPTNFNSENFDTPTSGGNLAETKLKVDISGNASFLGDLTSVSGSLTLNTNKFTVAGASGNTAIAGTLNVTGDVKVNTDKFTVTASTGNVTASGTITAGALSSNNGITAGTSISGASLSVTGTITGGSFVKTSGTSSQFLKADGSVDSNTYITSSGSASNATNADNINISAITSTDTTTSLVLVGNQATGNQSPFIDSGLNYNANTNALSVTGPITGSSLSAGTGAITGGAISGTSLSAGTGAITGGAITGSSFVKTSGTASQFLKADGSVDSNTYITSSGSASNATNATNATNADNINISATRSFDVSTSLVLVGNQVTGNQSPFIDSGLNYKANTQDLSVGGSINGASLSVTGSITGNNITSISSIGSILGTITGGVIKGTSLIAGTSGNTNGPITGGAITGSSLSAGTGTITGGSFVKTSGTASQFLKADGSVDSTIYANSTGTNASGIGWNISISGSSASCTGNAETANSATSAGIAKNVSGGGTVSATTGLFTDRIECVTPANQGTTGGIRIKANASNNAYIQFTNSTGSAEYANIVATPTNGNITLSGTLTVSGKITNDSFNTTSNAYGTRYIRTYTPTTEGVDGDIWYQTI